MYCAKDVTLRLNNYAEQKEVNDMNTATEKND